ncbi:MAG: tubulin-like doman-containing protein, partial [Planctomycetota bacterium]
MLAPEVFDGRPDFRSDQYSLALVFAELLTGRLPFQGKTTGELARQHLASQPDLDALPPADRPIVQRALAKNPLDRFSTCKQFVAQLQRVRASALPLVAKTTSPEEVNSVKRQESSLGNTLEFNATEKSAQGTVEFSQAPTKPESFSDSEQSRCYFLAVGGMGCRTLANLRSKVYQNCDARLSADDHGWLAIDTACESLQDLVDCRNEKSQLKHDQIVQLQLYEPIEYRNADPVVLEPISRRWLYNIPKSLRTEGVRPLALLTMLDHYDALRRKIKQDLEKLIAEHQQDSQCTEPLRIYLMNSIHGGTGSSLFCEIALVVRRVMTELNFSNYRICGNVLWAMTLQSTVASMPAATALTSINELQRLMEDDAVVPPVYRLEHEHSATHRPFDWVTLIDGGLHGDAKSEEPAIESLANHVFADSQTVLSALLAEDRTRSSADDWLRTAIATPLQLFDPVDKEALKTMCVLLAVNKAKAYLQGSKSSSSNWSKTHNSTTAASGMEVPLTELASVELTNRIANKIGIATEADSFEKQRAAKDGKEFLTAWARRISPSSKMNEMQMAEDLQKFRDAIRAIVATKVYTWKQVERIQLNAVEGILDYCDQGLDPLVQYFCKILNCSPESLKQNVVKYLRLFTEQCLLQLKRFQEESKDLTRRVESWSISLSADAKMDQNDLENRVQRLPTEIQALVARVTEVVANAIHTQIIRIVSSGVHEQSLHMDVKHDRPVFGVEQSLNSLIKTAREAFAKTSRTLNIDFSNYKHDQADEATDTLQIQEMDSCSPQLARYGSTLARFAIAPEQHFELLEGVLDCRGIRKSTCPIPAPLSFGVMLACDGVYKGSIRALTEYCRPSAKTLQLAERLHSRVDVDWAPIASMFEVSDLESNDKNSEQELPPTTATEQTAIPALPLPDSSLPIPGS